MTYYAGIDLHSNNSYLGIIDADDKRIFGKRLANSLSAILAILLPLKEKLKGIVVESTYNWYWLVDGLMENGFVMHLANPSAIKIYEGLKHSDDKSSAFWLAHLLRLNILPEGYIYPKEERPIRDLLRRRLLYVKQRTQHINSFKSMIARYLGSKMSAREIKKLNEDDAVDMFDSPNLILMAEGNIATIQFLTERIKKIEKLVKSQVKLKEEFNYLLTMPGIGDILGMTIMLEVGDITRFDKVGNYSSYCRCVKSSRVSNNKKTGEGNSKNGNRYLSWAYVEAAHCSIRCCKESQRFYQRKKAKTDGNVATKALANKLARASFYIMRDRVPFDIKKLFG